MHGQQACGQVSSKLDKVKTAHSMASATDMTSTVVLAKRLVAASITQQV